MPCPARAAEQPEGLLAGEVIGTQYSYDFNRGQSSTTVNTKANAFDGNSSTFFAAYGQSMSWVGLDLGTPHVITRMGLTPRISNDGPARTLLGVFEGANDPDFMDAVPLYLISQTPSAGRMTYYECSVSRGFRYVRYVGPASSRCQVADLEFYGYEGEGDDSHFYQITGLPTVSMHVINNRVPTNKGEDFDANITILYEDGTLIQEYPILTRVRGNFSASHENKPYRIKFNDGKSHHMLKGSLKDESPAKAKKWTLINNYRDKTLMRNAISFEMSRWVGLPYTPWCRIVDLLLNGEYRGTYLLCDWLGVDENRVDITEMAEDNVEGEELTGGYFIEVNGYAGGDPVHFTSNRGDPVTVHSPKDDVIQNVQYEYIRNHFNKMEAAVYSQDYTNPETGYRAYLDLESFLQYILSNEYCNNTDMLWQVFMYKQRGDDHIYTGPVWDHDLALENDDQYYPVDQVDRWTYQVRGAGDMIGLTSRVLSDPNAMSLMQELWGDLRNRGIFTEERVTAYVDSLRDRVRESATLNHIRWPYLLQRLPNNPGVWGTWEAEVDHVLGSMLRRLSWMDRKLRYNMLDVVKGVYQINSPLDLTTFVRFVNQKYELKAKAALTSDIDMSQYGERFEPIGSALRPFSGEFDGQSHRISNLHVDGNREVGFFGVLADGAHISNLNFDSSCTFSGSDYVGSVAGTVRKGSATIEGCGNEAPVTATGVQAGGLVGRSRTATVDISNSYNAGEVTAESEASALIGASEAEVTVSNSYNIGRITGSAEGSEFAASAAGVTLENCYDLYGSQAQPVTQEQLAGGELCYLLNGEGRSSVWRQNIDNGRQRDYHPVVMPRHGQVFKTADGYTNINPNAHGYRYFMFDFTAIQDGDTFQFAEFNLLDDEQEEVTSAVAYSGAQSSVEHENWPNASDHDPYTKYCGNFRGRMYVMVDAGEETSISGYRLYTANDTPSYTGRNPSTWRVCGSNVKTDDPDDANWEVLDERENDFTLGATSYTPYDFMLDNVLQQFAVSPASVLLNPGETRQLSIVAKPSSAVVGDAKWTSGDTDVVTVDGQGLITAVGVGTTTVSVTSLSMGGLTAECSVTVTDEVIGYRYYVLQVDEISGGDILQLSEVALLDSDGNEMEGLAIYNGPDVYFTNESWRNLCDRNTGTKYCGKFTNGSGVFLYFDARERVKPDGYRLYTANDTQGNPSRNPRSWKLWGADERTTATRSDNWVLLDERTRDTTMGATNYTPYDFGIDWVSLVGVARLSATPTVPGVVYDLQGRRVTHPTRGLYIKDGRKILITK